MKAYASSDGSGAAFWDAVAEGWVGKRRQNLWRQHADAVARRLVARWLPERADTVLKTDLFDEAVGDGVVTALRNRTSILLGIDVSPEIVQAACARFPYLRGAVTDVRALPFDRAQIDAVISLSTLDHFDDAQGIEHGLAEIRRVLKPRGRLVLTLDNPRNPIVAMRQATPRRWLDQTGIVPYACGRTLSPAQLARTLRASGFEILEETATIHCPRVLAVALAQVVEAHGGERAARAFRRGVDGFERLASLHSRWLTGHFSAVLASARA